MMKVECIDEPCLMPICVPSRESVCSEGFPYTLNDRPVSCGPQNDAEVCPSTHTCQLDIESRKGVCCSKSSKTQSSAYMRANINFSFLFQGTYVLKLLIQTAQLRIQLTPFRGGVLVLNKTSAYQLQSTNYVKAKTYSTTNRHARLYVQVILIFTYQAVYSVPDPSISDSLPIHLESSINDIV